MPLHQLYSIVLTSSCLSSLLRPLEVYRICKMDAACSNAVLHYKCLVHGSSLSKHVEKPQPWGCRSHRSGITSCPSCYSVRWRWRIPRETPMHWEHDILLVLIWARVKRRYERLQLRSAITTQNMWFTVCSDRGPYVAIPLFRLCLWLKLPVGRMTFQSFDVRVRHWSSRSGLVFLGSCKMACRQVYMR